jgi:ERF superfamily
MPESKEKSFDQLMLEVQKEVGAVKKTSDNPHFRSTYADLNEVLATVLPVLNSKGLRLLHQAGKDQFGQFVTTSVINANGVGEESTSVYFSGTEENMQKIGAAITYARRFGIASLLALEQEDDDGETAVGRGKQPAPKAQAPKPAAPAYVVTRITAQAGPVTAVQATAALPATDFATAPPFDRALCLKTVKTYCKVAVDKKLVTADAMVGMVAAHGSPKTDGLSDTELQLFLTELKGIVNA